MKYFIVNLFFLIFLLSCSNKTIADLEPNILNDDSVLLFTLFDGSVGGGKVSVSFTSIYDQLPPETQASITNYRVFRNDVEVSSLPLSSSRMSANGPSGSVVCLSIAFGSAEGPSRRSALYCRQIP